MFNSAFGVGPVLLCGLQIDFMFWMHKSVKIHYDDYIIKLSDCLCFSKVINIGKFWQVMHQPIWFIYLLSRRFHLGNLFNQCSAFYGAMFCFSSDSVFHVDMLSIIDK